MVYGQQPGQDGQQGWPGNDGTSPPPSQQGRYGEQEDTQGPGQFAQRGYDTGGQQPEWRYWQQRLDARNAQQGSAPGQPQFQPRSQPTLPLQPGQQGFGAPPPRPPYQPPRRGKSWPARHKALTGLLAFAVLIVIIAAANAGRSPAASSRSMTAGVTTPSATASPAAAGTPSRHATQTATAVQKAQPEKTQTTPAASHAPASSAPASSAAAPAPSTTAPTTPAAVVPPPTSAAPASCHPLTNGGKCYEPGEYCRVADHGTSGVAGDGKAITCENNDGWRWEAT